MNFLKHGCIHHQIGEDLLCMKILRPGLLVFDVGANVGYPTILFSRLVTRTGNVIAFEPSPRAFALLRRTTAECDNVECLPLAASDRKGDVVFYETASLDTSSVIPTGHIRSYSVSTCTLSEIAAEKGQPDFVKIDVEGHEESVLHGMRSILEHATPPTILFEAASRSALEKASNLIQQYAGGVYSFYGINRDGTLCGMFDTPDMSNYLALPSAVGPL